MTDNSEVTSKTSHEKQIPGIQQLSIRKRPFSVTLLAVLVLIFLGFHLIRFVRALQLWDVLVSLPGVPALYLTLTGLIWTIIGIPLLWMIWRGHPKTPATALVVPVLFSIYFWIDRLLIANTSSGLPNLPFLVAANALLLVFTLWASINPKSRRYFKGEQRASIQGNLPDLQFSNVTKNYSEQDLES
ncbi:MAG: hypothetical protein ACNA8H_04980 [Anaerolineales bacterium]